MVTEIEVIFFGQGNWAWEVVGLGLWGDHIVMDFRAFSFKIYYFNMKLVT